MTNALIWAAAIVISAAVMAANIYWIGTLVINGYLAALGIG